MNKEKLSIPPVQLRLTVIKQDRILFVTEYTKDRSAIIEAADQFNGHKKFDLVAHVSENRILIIYNGNLLLKDRKAYGHPKATAARPELDQIGEIIESINREKGRGLKAKIETAAASDNAIEKYEANKNF